MKKKLQDYVWQNCLPKEFKEEVKKLYSRFLFTREGYYDELFGKHNLTSDAEREDEILTANKKDVQEQYALQIAALRKGNLSDIEVEYRVKLKDMLEYLFGSKCLPDDTNLSEKLTGSEPKPAEPKYHVGDWVRVISTDKYGYIGKITEVEINDSIFYRITSVEDWLFLEKNLEPYTEQRDTILQPFCQRLESAANTEPKDEVVKMKPIESKVSVYLATKKEDEEFRMLLHENGFMWNMGNSLIDKSNWASDPKDYQIHFVYPDMTVTYCGERTMDTLTFNEFKKRYFDEDVNLSHESANCDKEFDNILKDSFSKERRLNIAKDFVAVLLSRLNYDPFTAQINCCCSDGEAVNPYTNIARIALSAADALIYESQLTDKKRLQ